MTTPRLTPLRAKALALRLEALINFRPLALSTVLHQYHYGPPDPCSHRLARARLRLLMEDEILLTALHARAGQQIERCA